MLRPCDLDRLLRESIERYGDADYAAGEPVWVEMDCERIRDVVDRLMQNAIRHSRSRIRVSLRVTNGKAVVTVADSGPGIPQNKLESIFGEFEQLSLGPGRTVGGVGLGLAIVKLVVERHGGRVWAESEVGKGACFRFSLKTCSPPVEKYHDDREGS